MLRPRGAWSARSRSVARRSVAAAASVLFVLGGAGAVPPAAASASTPAETVSARAASSTHARSSHACSLPGRHRLSCHAMVRTDVAPMAVRFAATPSASSGYGPADLQSAYGLAAAAAAGGAGMTVAVIDAYDDPTAEQDLAAYRAAYGLPPCTSSGANPCFRKVNERGAASPLPAVDTGWSKEISLDLDMVSAVCPNCSILLVEADSAYSDDLGIAVNTAVSAGAKFVSNSYGGPEDSWATSLDTWYYKHPGVVITASTGDWGYEGYQGGTSLAGNSYPAVSPWVVAVGGTTLSRAANTRGWSESAWADAGSGCSVQEPRPAWQSSAVTGCSKRMVADVSAVADPATGVAVVYNNAWYQMGGTSAAAPIVAAAYALAGAPSATVWPGSYPYYRGGLNDAAGGSNAANGSCSPDPSLWCAGVAGYDGPTGLGTPNGILPFTAPTAPGAPQGVTGTAGNASVAVSWSAPASNGGAVVTGYTATAQPGGTTCRWTSGPLTCTISGLANGTAYAFTVAAANVAGTGSPSAPSAPVTPRTVPGAPTSVSGIPGAGSVAVSWAPPASNGGVAITRYTVTASPGGAACAWAAGPYTCTVTGLGNGTPYTFTVTATNAAGTGPASAPSAAATPRTVPGAPLGVTARPANGAAQVAWSPPSWNGGAAITAYKVTSAPGGLTCAWASGPLDCTISGLRNGTAYTFTVTAGNAAGMGAASGASTPVTPAGVPDAPSGVIAAPAPPSFGAVRVTWQAAGANGSAVTSYLATAYAAGTFTPLGTCVASAIAPAAPALGCTIGGLGNGVAVVARVSAANAQGAGPLSAPSAAFTTPVPVTAAVRALPTWTVAASFTVAWSHAGGTYAVARYDVRYRRSTWAGPFGSYALWKSGTTAASATFVPATGSTYCFSARVVDQGGFVGPWSADRCTTTPLDDRSLWRTGTWSIGTGSAFYRSTWSRSYAYGAKLVRPQVLARRIVLVATTCPTCGSVRVYWGSTLLRTISLYSSTTINRRVLTVVTFTSLRAGTVTVKLSTSGRKVLIDGLGATRV